MNLWPHQSVAIEGVESALAAGEQRVCLTVPTGGGKTLIACNLIDQWVSQGHRVAIYTNRKMLFDQLSRYLENHGIDHGRRASGYEDEQEWPVQIATIQTEDSRVFKRGKWELHDAQRVIVDEAHLNKSEVVRKILDHHLAGGAAYVGLTATPIGIGDLYNHLVQAGVTSELRECGALVMADHHGPDEPDLRHIGKVEVGKDLTEKQNVKAIMRHGIFGRVLDWFGRLNPEHRPTILFAPGVAESIWFAERFVEAGITAAHIDGESVWVNGELHRSSRVIRDQVIAGSRDGSIKVLCNRFVLREGIDCPWLAHGILATVFGSLQSFLQSGGRLLRAHPSLDKVVIQDHGGNWWRHGSLNADRHWELTRTAAMISGMREERFRAKVDREPARCPQCARIIGGLSCPCGYKIELGTPKSRPVVMADGTLKQMRGDIFQPRRVAKDPKLKDVWIQMYYRSRNADRTFRAAEALFAKENNWQWPDRLWPLMPIDSLDFFKDVKAVPVERLRSRDKS